MAAEANGNPVINSDERLLVSPHSSLRLANPTSETTSLELAWLRKEPTYAFGATLHEDDQADEVDLEEKIVDSKVGLEGCVLKCIVGVYLHIVFVISCNMV